LPAVDVVKTESVLLDAVDAAVAGPPDGVASVLE
jgi:hypothetical protein